MNNLNEMANIFPKAKTLMENWNERISIVEEVNNAPLSYERKVVLAQCLENTQQAITAMEATDYSAVGQFKHYALDLITAIIPNLVANDIVSIQPIDNEVGVINYIKYIYGSSKGSAVAGDEFASSLLYKGSDPYYSSQAVVGEGLTKEANNKLTGNLAWKPLLKGSIKVAVSYTKNGETKTVNVVDSTQDGKLVAVDALGAKVEDVLETATIDYNSGAISITLASETTLDENVAGFTVDYHYDQKSIGDGAIGSNTLKTPEVNIKIESMPVVCQSRKLKALYAFDASFKLQKEYGSDINALLNSQIAAEIAHEIDGEIMNDLLTGAGLMNDGWSRVIPEGISLKDHYESFYANLVVGSNKIFGATKRAVGNFLIVGLDVASVLEVMPGFQNAGVTKVVGPHIMGTVGNFTVIKNPYFPPTKYVMGYKGASLFDAGYFYCPYMPVITTQLVMLDDFVGRKGWATSYAKKMVQPLLYCAGEIANTK